MRCFPCNEVSVLLAVNVVHSAELKKPRFQTYHMSRDDRWSELVNHGFHSSLISRISLVSATRSEQVGGVELVSRKVRANICQHFCSA